MKKYIFMNLKTVFSVLFIAVGLFSCSDDHVIDENPEPEIVYDATLSVVLKHDTTKVKTKADTDKDKNEHWSLSKNFVSKLSIAVFQRDKLVKYAEASSSDKGIYELNEIKVPSGAVKIIVLGNTDISGDLQKVGTDLDLYKESVSKLEKEKYGYLSMSSGVLEYNLRAGHNYIGYGKSTGTITVNHGDTPVSGVELTGAPIKLTRNAARVFLYLIKINPKAEYQGVGNVKFTLKEIFLTNVKGYSKCIWESQDNSTTVEVASGNQYENFWQAGGSIGTMPEDVFNVEAFNYNFANPPQDIEEYNELYPQTNGIWDRVMQPQEGDNIPSEGIPAHIPGQNKEELTLATGTAIAQLGYGGGFPIGVDFFVYENTDEARPTALVIKGDYSYCPKNEGEYEIIDDTYYTIVINEKGLSANFGKGEGSSSDEVFDYENVPPFIHQNTEYCIYATVVGPGSKKPLDAHISAEIVVKNWDVVEQNEEVD